MEVCLEQKEVMMTVACSKDKLSQLLLLTQGIKHQLYLMDYSVVVL